MSVCVLFASIGYVYYFCKDCGFIGTKADKKSSISSIKANKIFRFHKYINVCFGYAWIGYLEHIPPSKIFPPHQPS